APYVEAHERGPLLDLGIRSLDCYDAWIDAVRRESGTDVEYRRIGTLEVALDADQASALQRASGSLEGVEAEWMEPEAARREQPALGPLAGALMIGAHGYVAAPQLATALFKAAERGGAKLVRTRVESIARRKSSFEVQTSTGVLQAQLV